MNIYLISNNLVINNITYETDASVDEKRLTRVLSIEGEELAKKLAKKIKVSEVYSSAFASAIETSKYLADANNLTIKINKRLNDAKIGKMNQHNIKMIRYMQERNYDFKYESGESLNETSSRMNNVFKSILKNTKTDIAIVTHKRAIMALLLKKLDTGFNLEDRLILSYNNKVLLDDTENDIDIIRIKLVNNKIEDIDVIDL